MAAIQDLKRGTLSIGSVQSLPAFLDLPSALARFFSRYPGIDIHLSQGSSNNLLEKVRDGRLDLAFLPLCEPPSGVATTVIACEELVIACAADNPLAGREKVALSELVDEPFVDFELDWGTRRLVDRAFSAARLDRRITFEVNDLKTLLELVARGLGVALVPAAVAQDHRPSLGIAQVAGPEICWELVVAHAAGHRGAPANPASRAFLELMNAVSPG